MRQFFIERITDISNELCRTIDEMDSQRISKNRAITNVLEELYRYHRANGDIHPLTNWHAHRLRCMSCIASKLQDIVKIWECHYFILQYLYERAQCPCHLQQRHTCKSIHGANHDFYHRDSLSYLVYGSQALANACAYLKDVTRFDYRPIFCPILTFLQPYLEGKKVHIEYVRSEIQSDYEKPEYGKPWDPNYASTFLRILHHSLNMEVPTVCCGS